MLWLEGEKKVYLEEWDVDETREHKAKRWPTAA